MANELKHGTVGTELTQAEWEAVGAHVLDAQAIGDLIYASTIAQLRRLGIGTSGQPLTVSAGGIPQWGGQMVMDGLLNLSSKSIINYPVFLRQRTGMQQHSNLIAGMTFANAVITVDTLFAIPFIVPVKCTLNALYLNVTTQGAAGAKARLGVYNDNGNLYPDARQVDGGELDCTTTGLKTATISTQLTPGVYWLAVLVNDGTIQASKVSTTVSLASSALQYDYESGWSVAQAYGALPATFTGGGGLDRPYRLFYRIASYDD